MSRCSFCNGGFRGSFGGFDRFVRIPSAVIMAWFQSLLGPSRS